MLAIDYLNQVNKIDRLLANKQFEIEYWQSLAEGTGSITSGDEKVQSQPSPHKMENAVCQYIELQEQVVKELERLVGVRNEVIKTIEQLPSEEYTMLHHIYIQHHDLLTISIELKKSTRTIIRAHKRGIELVQKILDQREEQNVKRNK